ncbi:MAG: SpoIIE family protein phosphatase [Clostridiales bacterium]|nr:SpoIIE family protein phosphatase [Clostridiales bacterium]
MKATSFSGAWRQARRGFADRGERLLRQPAVPVLLECAGRLALGAALTLPRVLDSCAPFALGFVAASGSGPGGFCALIGASLGYLTNLGLVSGLRYVSASILIYALSFAFYDLAIYRRAWFLPVCSALLGGLTGLFTLATERWSRADLTAEAVEMALVALSAWLYRAGLRPWLEPEEPPAESRVSQAGLLFLGGSLAAALWEAPLLGPVNLGAALSGALVLVLAQRQGPEAVSAGVVLGLVLDLCSGGGGLYTGALALGGLLAGAARERGRLASCLLFFAGGSLTALWNASAEQQAGLAVSLGAAALAVSLLPPRIFRGRTRDRPQALPRARAVPVQEHPSYTRRQLQAKLMGQANAFQTLYEDMRKGLVQSPVTDQRLEQIFDRAAEQVCQDCPRYEICWKQDYHETYRALHQMLGAMKQRGYGRLNDAPAAFAGSCRRAGELISAANVEYASLLHRRQLDARLRASRSAVWRQYAQLSQLLGQAARELEYDLRPDPEQATGALRFLRRHGLEAEIRLGRDPRGRMVIQLTGGDLSLTQEGTLLEDLSRNMGMTFAAGPLERERGVQRLTLVQEDRFLARAGVAALSREGQTVSGDGGNWFRDRDGRLWVVLCDGMGSGPGAAGQSRLALRLLEDFLRAGVGADVALATLSNALALRGESELGFTTIDLLGIDLFSGECRSYKLGAAPTYLRLGGRVKKLSGGSLPAGLEFGQESRPDVRSFSLAPEDMAVMVSDGVSDGEGDDWLWQLIRDFRGERPKELATRILERSSGGKDDRTVIVLQLRRREAAQSRQTEAVHRQTPRAG